MDRPCPPLPSLVATSATNTGTNTADLTPCGARSAWQSGRAYQDNLRAGYLPLTGSAQRKYSASLCAETTR
jgi:hypothetical protein